MRAYDPGLAALALDVDPKWLDNAISLQHIPGVVRETRGVTRKLSMRALVVLAVVRDLQRELGVPISRAVPIARALLDAPRVPAGPHVAVTADVAAVERAMTERLAAAIERFVPRRRGRPPRKHSGAPRRMPR